MNTAEGDPRTPQAYANHNGVIRLEAWNRGFDRDLQTIRRAFRADLLPSLSKQMSGLETVYF